MSNHALQQPSILGQVPINFYTQILLGFRVPATVERDALVKSLSLAKEKLIRDFPFLGGRVVLEGKQDNRSGIYRVVAGESSQNFIVKDCSSECKDLEAIVKANAPSSMLNGNLLSPAKGLPENVDATQAGGLPIHMLQLNFVRGGLILCSSCMHQSLDMNGHAQLLRLFAKICAGGSPSREELEQGNLDASKLVPSLGDNEKLADVGKFPSPPIVHDTTQPSPGEPISAPWRYFRITSNSLQKLKTEASAQLPGTETAFISTNDILVALLWQRTAIARSRRLGADTVFSCYRSIDARKRLSPTVPKTYMGHMVVMSKNQQSQSEITSNSLSSVGQSFRHSLKKMDDNYIRSLATLLRKGDDKSYRYAANFTPGRDIIVSSWAGLELATLSFGPDLGTPTFIRRPNQVDFEGMIFPMPKSAEGDIDVAISLREADYSALDEDAMWTSNFIALG